MPMIDTYKGDQGRWTVLSPVNERFGHLPRPTSVRQQGEVGVGEVVAHGWAIQPSASRVRTENKAAAVPEIADQQMTLDAEIAAASDDAAVEIARFATEVGHEVAPFAAVLLRSESAASSRIENLTASARAIAEVELSGPGGGETNRCGSVAATLGRTVPCSFRRRTTGCP